MHLLRCVPWSQQSVVTESIEPHPHGEGLEWTPPYPWDAAAAWQHPLLLQLPIDTTGTHVTTGNLQWQNGPCQPLHMQRHVYIVRRFDHAVRHGRWQALDRPSQPPSLASSYAVVTKLCILCLGIDCSVSKTHDHANG